MGFDDPAYAQWAEAEAQFHTPPDQLPLFAPEGVCSECDGAGFYSENTEAPDCMPVFVAVRCECNPPKDPSDPFAWIVPHSAPADGGHLAGEHNPDGPYTHWSEW